MTNALLTLLISAVWGVIGAVWGVRYDLTRRKDCNAVATIAMVVAIVAGIAGLAQVFGIGGVQ